MKYIFVLIIICYTIYSQWTVQLSGTAKDLWGVSFINENIGLIVGDSGKILRTSNGGANWFNIASGTSYWLLSVKFIDANTALACGDYGIILRSTNTGLNWTQVASGTDLFLRYINNNGNTCFAVGNDGIAVQSTNGGISWSVVNVCNNIGNKAVYLISPSNVIISCWQGWIMRTTNSGANWNCLFTGQSLEGLSFSGNNIGNIVGFNGRILRTTNAGQNWFTQDIPGMQNWYFGVQLINDNTGYIVGENAIILKTTNGGYNWNQQTSGALGYLYMLYFINANTGTIVGNFGTILRTTNGGSIGLQQIGTEVPDKFSLSQNYPNPFNPNTFIDFAIPKTQMVNLIIYDITGAIIDVLVREQLSTGYYRYEYNAEKLSSGVYFYRLETESYSVSRKMIVLK
ncbi:MAG TPA: YCF48-related protein [Ignavibacteria bacterium]|nr:YCF48-related protein [Ignavibacteria bacterium]